MKSRKTIKSRVFHTIFILTILLTLVVDLLLFFVYKKDVEQKVLEFSGQTVSQITENLSRNVMMAEEAVTYKMETSGLYTKEGLQIRSDTPSNNTRNLRTYAALLENNDFAVRNTFLMTEDGATAFSSRVGTSPEDFQNSFAGQFLLQNYAEFDDNRGTVLWRRFEDAQESVFLYKIVINPDTMKRQGVICIEIGDDYFEAYEEDSGIQIILEDENGELLYCTDELKPSVKQIRDNPSDYLCNSGQIQKKGWTLLGLVSRQAVLMQLRHLLLLLLLIETVFIVLAGIIAYRATLNVTADITALVDNMKRLERGEMAEEIHSHTESETGYLVETFNAMNRKLQETVELLAYNRTEVDRAEYNALLAQLNPHFIYNALESISSMAKLRKETEIAEAIQRLSVLMRITLNESSLEIPLQVELDYVTQYLSLQKLITGGRIDWDMECPKELNHQMVPKLILQPVVENCIKHAFSDSNDDAVIVILAKKSGETLILEVADNGCGMKQEAIDRFQKGETWGDVDRKHIGLQSIRQRILHMYGESYGIRIESEEGKGTRIDMLLPLLLPEVGAVEAEEEASAVGGKNAQIYHRG